MKNPRHLFILVGFLAQSLTWDNYFVTGIVLLLWGFAATRWHHRFDLRLSAEAAALLAGCVLSVAVSKILQRSAHFFIGDGLIALQLVRLIRPLNRREKLTSVVIACFHLGVLCTLAPNLRFIVLFLAGLYLLPGALKDAYYDRDATLHTRRLTRPCEIQFVPTMRVCLWLLLGSVFVFITFPRFTGSPLQLRDGFDQGSLLDTILDPRRGGRANSQQVLLQVEGIDVGYLRCFALTEFDGIKWSKDTSERVMQTRWFDQDKSKFSNPRRYLPRKVYVKNAHYLGRFVPVDGMPETMRQTFFTRPVLNVGKGSDALEAHAMWTASENIYEYYIDTRPSPRPLPPDLRAHLTRVPPQSERLQTWVSEVTASGTNDLEKARLLETHLRDNFRYEIGTPELSRLAPTEDFIFDRKAGHCERFAAGLALFLRMQGIPSRIAIGYVPTHKNIFSGRMQVRFADAHSWTEGYFEGVGWVTFDATPGPPPGTRSSDLLDLIDELEFAWYSNVVNFNGYAQRELADGLTQLVGKTPRCVWTMLAAACALVIAGGAAARVGFKLPRRFRFSFKRGAPSADLVARHYYDEMVEGYRKRGIAKPPAHTPLEFLEHLRLQSAPGYSDATLVTDRFCHSYYGGKPLDDQQRAETEKAVQRLREHAARQPVKRS